MAYQALFFWRMFLRQRVDLRVVAGGTALLAFTPVGASLHGFIERTVRIVTGNHFRFSTAGTCDDEHCSQEGQSYNGEEIFFYSPSCNGSDSLQCSSTPSVSEPQHYRSTSTSGGRAHRQHATPGKEPLPRMSSLVFVLIAEEPRLFSR